MFAVQKILSIILTLVLSALPLGHEVKVIIGSDEWPGVVRSRDLHSDEKGQYRSVIEFKYPQDKAYYSGQNAKVVY